MVQNSNIQEGTADPLAKPGIFGYYTSEADWTDSQATLTLQSTDNDALDVMLRCQDSNNLYPFR